jgi:hypothetical protein
MPFKFLFKYTRGHLVMNLQIDKCNYYSNDLERKRCGKDIIIGQPYCWIHLIKKLSLRIKKTDIGKGLIAQNTIKFNENKKNEIIFEKNQTIGIYLGELISEEEMDNRYQDKMPTYALKMDDNLYVDAGARRFYGGLFNHSKNPNCITKIKSISDFIKEKEDNYKEFQKQFNSYINEKENTKMIAIFIIANKDINYGEELFIDYDKHSRYPDKQYKFENENKQDYDTKYFRSKVPKMKRVKPPIINLNYNADDLIDHNIIDRIDRERNLENQNNNNNMNINDQQNIVINSDIIRNQNNNEQDIKMPKKKKKKLVKNSDLIKNQNNNEQDKKKIKSVYKILLKKKLDKIKNEYSIQKKKINKEKGGEKKEKIKALLAKNKEKIKALLAETKEKIIKSKENYKNKKGKVILNFRDDKDYNNDNLFI